MSPLAIRRLLLLTLTVGAGVVFAGGTAMARPSVRAAPQPTASCAFTRPDAVKAYGKPLDKTIWGRLCQLRDGKATMARGVRITVTKDGKKVGQARTGANGVFVVPIPANGTYQVSLDLKTLPKGFNLTSASAATLPDVNVNLGDQQVAFRLGTETRGQRTFSDYATSFASGLKLGLILAVAAVGLSLVFGVTGLVNFSHGELVTFGALIAYMFNAGLGKVPLLVAGGLALVGTAAFGLFSEVGLWRPLRHRGMSTLSMMVVSIGLSILLRSIMQILAGPSRLQYRFGGLQQEVKFGPFSLTPNDWVIGGLCIIVLIATTIVLKRTRLGMAIRAVADNRDLAESSGIDVDNIIGKVWMIGAGLAGIGGVFYGLSFYVQYDMGFTILLSLFAAVVLGGLGSAYGAILGALVIGIVQETSGFALNNSDYKFVIALSVLIVVLLFRPQGILGNRERFG